MTLLYQLSYLPKFLLFEIVGRVGLEPTTQGSVSKCNRNTLCFLIVGLTGLEPMTFGTA